MGDRDISSLGTEGDVWIGKFGKDASLATAEERREGRKSLGGCFDNSEVELAILG